MSDARDAAKGMSADIALQAYCVMVANEAKMVEQIRAAEANGHRALETILASPNDVIIPLGKPFGASSLDERKPKP